MKLFPTRPTSLLALSLLLPLASSCALAQDGQNQRPKRGKGQPAKQRGPAQNRPNANANANANADADAENQGLADIEVADDPNAGQTFPIQAPQNVAIPVTNTAPPQGAIFVSPDAKAGAGTSAAAPTTLQNALKNAPDGATIVLRGGTYRVGQIMLPRRLTLQAFPGESPWLKGSVVVSNWVKDGNLWRHNGWTAEFKPEGRLERVITAKYPMAVYGDQAFLDGKALFQVGSRDKVKPGQFFVDHASDALYIGDDPTGKMAEATVHESGIIAVKRGAADASGSVLRGVGLTHYARQAMLIAAPNITLENCAFVWNGNRGLYFNAGSGTDAENCVVRGSKLIANGQAGLSAGRAPNLLFEKNLVTHNNVEGFSLQWGAAGVKFFGFDGLVCHDNVVEYNNGTGIWLDVNANKATVVRNQSNFNKGGGIFFEVSDVAIIAFNVCRGNGAGIHIANSHNAQVYNNTLVNNERNVRVNQGARVNTGQKGGTPDDTVVANTPPGGTFTVRGNVFKNNILWNSRPDTTRALFDFDINLKQPQAARLASLMVTGLSHNAYYRAGDNLALQAWSKNGGAVERYNTLEEFTAASGKGQNSVVTTGADVYFADAAQANFALKPGSPAIGAAAPLPADVAQAAGVPQNIGYLGALPPA